MVNGFSKNWGESFNIDPWGNLLSITPSKCSAENLQVSVAPPPPLGSKNQITISGYTYDAAGNMTLDGQGHSPAYDAENRIKTAAGVNYTYDVDGKRVKKDSGKLYWTGTGSDALTETDLSGTPTADYVFFNGKRIARVDLPSGAAHYYFSDHLGSADVVTNATGTTIEQESDYYPYGGERIITAGANNYKFTGKERDSETGLDYFGARYYGSTMGRFLSVDPSSVSIDKTDPQSWNRYSYTLNNPLRFVDTNGKWPTEIHNKIIDKAFPGLSQHQRNILKEASRRVDALIPGQLDSHSHDHAMKSAKDKDAAAARAQIDESIANKEANAAKENTGHIFVSDKALDIFGEAGHTVMDRTSPAHTDENGDPKEWHISEAGEHKQAEANITPEQMNKAVQALQDAYYDTFGNAAGKQATRPSEQAKKKENEKEPL